LRWLFLCCIFTKKYKDMALANYIPTTCKVTPGNRNRIYIAPASAVTAMAETANEISTFTATADAFKIIQADFDSVQFTSEATFKTAGGYTQNLIARFANATPKNLNILVDELRDVVACGAAIIWIDGGGNALFAGVSVAAKEGGARPFNQMATSFDSGVTLTDEDLQSETLTFTRISIVRPMPFDATLLATITGGTAAFIDWPE
jgi:hypothetical protein